MIVIKSVAEYAATVRRVAKDLNPRHLSPDTVRDLNEAAGILEHLADNPQGISIEEMPLNISEDES